MLYGRSLLIIYFINLSDVLIPHLEITENVITFRDKFPNMEMRFYLFQHSKFEKDLDAYFIYQKLRGGISDYTKENYASAAKNPFSHLVVPKLIRIKTVVAIPKLLSRFQSFQLFKIEYNEVK